MIFTFKHQESGEVRTVEVSEQWVQDALDEQVYELLECGCQPIGETNVIECGCEDYFEGFELQNQIA